MYDDPISFVPTVSPRTAERLRLAERQLRVLEHLVAEVGASRYGFVPDGGPASWRSDASAHYGAILASVREGFQGGADDLVHAHDALTDRVALMRRALAAAEAGAETGA
ncbi:hypothetical protein ACGGZK_04070 [Agromyces sp. MMS24-K17]|uniref:hypothetical protein n=1 Tax=Agromyces sp. MMS24-K17 TaxID=3372850 RepID=UPI003754C906